ncbi:MAG: PAS domain S-box protein [Acidobacteria bacterium]|nr:PAS domain S-box protein [Acidobacteriota bacterium]
MQPNHADHSRTTDRKDLQSPEERLRDLVEDLDAIVWEAEAPEDALGASGALRFSFVSGRAESILGYPVGRWLGEQGLWPSVVHPDDRARVERTYSTVLLEGRYGGIEYRVVAADGRTVWIRDRVHAVRSAGTGRFRLHGVMMDISDRVEAESALKRGEERYRAFVEQSTEGIWCYEADQPMPVDFTEDEQIDYFYAHGRLTDCNAVFAQMYGFDEPEDVIGARVGDLLPRSDPRNEEYLRAFVRAGYRLSDVESHEVDRAGGSKYFLNNLVGIVEDGRLVRAWGTQRNVTQSKQAEEEIRRQTVFFRELFNSAPNAILIVDMNDRIVDANRGFERTFQYSAEEVRGRQVNDFIVPPDLAVEASDLSRQALRGDIVRKESVRKRRDGSLLTVSILSYPIMVDGRLEAIYAIYSDITERTRVNAALREVAVGVSAGTGEAFFQTLARQLTRALDADYAVIARFATGSEDRIRSLAVCRRGEILENIEYDLVGTPCEGAAHGALCYYANDVQRLFPRDEMLRTMSVESYMGVPLFDSTGRAFGLMAVLHGRPLSNESLARSMLQIFGMRVAAELERTQAEEALRRSEEQLRHSQKMEAVGRLAGGIAHDFNNLLTAISGYSELILIRMPASDPLRRQVEEIRKAGERAASLTRQLLAFSRKQVLQPRVLDLNAVVIEMDKMLRRLIGEDVLLSTILQDGLGRVKADPSQLEQVIVNLAVNARDAMPRGGRLVIQTANIHSRDVQPAEVPELRPGEYVMLAISDNGVGMEPDVLGRMFEPFFTTKEKGKGTGLGLSTVYGIVRQSDGYISVSSAPGLGTTFKIYLPYVAEAADVPAGGGTEVQRTRGTETILLVEDEDVVRRMTREILEGEGYKVLEAADGQEALLICEKYEGPIQLLLTDVVMPGLNGHELAEALSESRPGIPVLYMSGHTGDTIIGKGARIRRSAFLQKPFVPHALAHHVRQLLDDH